MGADPRVIIPRRGIRGIIPLPHRWARNSIGAVALLLLAGTAALPLTAQAQETITPEETTAEPHCGCASAPGPVFWNTRAQEQPAAQEPLVTGPAVMPVMQPPVMPAIQEPPGPPPGRPEPVQAEEVLAGDEPYVPDPPEEEPPTGVDTRALGELNDALNADAANPDDAGDVHEGPLRDPVLRQEASDPLASEGEPDAASAADALAAGPPAEEASPMEICAQPDEAQLTVLQRVRRSLTVTACASSAWLDGLFGDQIHYDDYHATYGTVTLGGLWSDYDGFDPRLRFRARLQLPQWDERISAFAGRVGEEDYISDTEGDFDALPTRQFGTLEDESVLLGLGYSSPERTGNDFDAGVGVRVDLPLDPYARTRYEIVRSFADRYVFSARETVFWQNSEGFGTTTRVNFDRVISDRFLLRWSNLGKYTEETIGLEWYSQVTLFQSVGQRTGLAWQAQIEGATDNEVQLTRHSLRLIARRQLTPDWLILELRSGVSWPRRHLYEKREPSPEVGIAFEMQFGQKRAR